MKLGLLFVLIVAATPFLVAQKSTEPTKQDEQTIRKLEQELLTAYYKGDVATMSRFEANDFTVASEEGRETKQEQIENVRKRQPADVHEAFKANTWNIRFFGPVAVVDETGDNYSTEKGMNDHTTLVMTSVWAQHGGEWKIQDMHYSELKTKK